MAFRLDRGKIGEYRIDHNGSLIVAGALTRTGVFTYKHQDGSVTRELRHPDDVKDAKSVASFIQVPITDEHPTEGRVTPENVRKLQVGNVGDTVRVDGDLLVADLVIRDKDAIAKVRGDDGPAKRELSCGYQAEVIEESGTYNGEKYDHRQTNIVGNHIALVRAGRAGSEVRILMDSADAMLVDDDTAWADVSPHLFNPDHEPGGPGNKNDTGRQHEETDMKDVTIKFKGVEAGDFKVDASDITVPEGDAVKTAESLVQNIYDAAEIITSQQGEIDTLAGERDTLQNQLDESESISPERLNALSEQRRVIMDVAEHVGFPLDKLATLDNEEIKSLVVRKDDSDMPEDVSPEYVDGCFRGIQRKMDKEGESKKKMASLGDATRPVRTDSDGDQHSDDDLTPRQISEKKLRDVHNKTDSQLREMGWN